METQKPLEFHGTALGYFIVSLLSGILIYIPFFGWALLLNYASGWLADNALVNGKKVTFKAGYGESLGFVSINALLLIVTLGIYIFWFYPKMYRYVADHVQYAGEAVAAPVAPVGDVMPAAEPMAVSSESTVTPAEATAAPQPPADPTQPQPPAPAATA